MRKSAFPVLLFLLLYALSSCTSNTPSQTNIHPALDTLNVELPEGIHELENLAVFPSLKSPQYHISFTRADTFRSPVPEPFGEGSEIVVSDSGIVIIRNRVQIYAFDAEGTFLAEMAGKGRGPGELNGFGKKQMAVLGDSLLVYDTGLERVNIYSLETFEPIDSFLMDPGEFADSERTRNLYPGDGTLTNPLYYPAGDSLLLVRFNKAGFTSQDLSRNSNVITTHPATSHYFLMNTEGQLVSEEILTVDHKILSAGGLLGIPALPVNNRELITVSQKGTIYTSESNHLLIKKYGPKGGYLGAIYYPQETVSYNKESFISSYSEVEEVRQFLRNTDLPMTMPALFNMKVDDKQRLWISTYAGNNNRHRWVVLDHNGEHLATFDWPADPFKMMPAFRSPIRIIHGGYLYVYEEASSADSAYIQGGIVRHKIELTER